MFKNILTVSCEVVNQWCLFLLKMSAHIFQLIFKIMCLTEKFLVKNYITHDAVQKCHQS